MNLNNNKRLKSSEVALHLLLAQFTKKVQQGKPPSFAAFKKVWVERHFSCIYMVSQAHKLASEMILAVLSSV